VNKTIISIGIMFIAASVFFLAPAFVLLGIAPATVELVAAVSFGVMAGNWMTFLLLTGGDGDE